MSYFERSQSPKGSTRRRDPAGTARNWSAKPLSTQQKARLSIAQRNAWAFQSQCGLAGGSFDDWKYAQTTIACGVASLREATNKQFRSILAHFLRLAGKVAEAEILWARTGRVAGSDQVHDTHENRESARALIRDILATSRGAMTEAYVSAILQDRFAGSDLHSMTARDLQQLVYLLRARLRKIIPR